jgi:predicted Zn-dependent peptidase
MYELTQLPGGFKVATAEMPHMQGVSMGIWVAAGSRFETSDLNGACHFIEHLLFKGTKTRSAREISEAVEGIGGHLNAFTSEETTCFHARVEHHHFEDVLEVLFDMLAHSRFAPGEIHKEREVIKEEIAMYQDEPQHHVQEVLNAAMWPGKALGRPITGTPKTLDAIDRKMLLEFLASHYGRNRLVLSVAGRVTHRQVLRAAGRLAKDLPTSPGFAYEPAAASDAPAPAFHLVSRDTEQTQLALGMRTCSRHDPDRYALRILTTLLGENMSSRLFQVLREDKGLVYSVYAAPSFFGDVGDLVVSAGLDPSNTERVLRLILQELRRLTREMVGNDDLDRAKDYIIGQIDLSRDSTESQMNWLGEQMTGYGRVTSPSAIKRKLCQVSREEIRETARRYFTSHNRTLAMVSPVKRVPGVGKLLGL